MKIGVIGTGDIGSGIARQLAPAGHRLMLSFSRNPARLVA
jgi:predicted dinucleotide-binding enzyme